MQAMILAAGEGRRLRPLTLTCPKPMLPVAGRPLVEHTLDWLYRHGVRDVALNVHHLPGAFAQHLGVGGRFGVRLTYSYEEELLGTAGALGALRDFFSWTFVVVYGDLLIDVDLAPLLALHRRRRAVATLGLRYAAVPQGHLAVSVDHVGRVTAAAASPSSWESELIGAGVCILEPQVLEYIPDDTPLDFGQDLLPRLLEAGLPVYAQPIWGYLLDINSHAAYARAQEDWGLTERAVGM